MVRTQTVTALILLLPTQNFLQAQTAAAASAPLTVAAIFAEHGGPVGEAPKDFVWSADGRTVSYVSADDEHGEPGDVIGIDAATGAATVLADGSRIATLGEMAAAQGAGTAIRDRDHRARYDEASYQWTPDGKHLLLDTNGALWLHDVQSRADVRVGATGLGSGDDPKYSPDGTRLSFVSGNNLHAMTVADGQETALTATRSSAVLNGAVDWLYEEELDARSNSFWSPDSQHIAYLQTDETAVPRYPLTDWMGRHAVVEMQRYPQPGDANPAVRVGVVSTTGGATVWMKIPLAENQDYVPRLGWVNAHAVWVEVLRRDQRRRSIYLADATTGRARRILTETDRRFLDENYDVEVFGNGRLLWTSWRDGHMHLYLYRFDAEHPRLGRARLEQQLTRGLWDVLSVCAVDEKRGVVYFTSNESDPREEMLWRVHLDGTGKTMLSTVHGVHDIHFNAQGDHYVDTISTRMTPPVVSVCAVEGTCHPFWKAHALPPGLTLVRPEWVVSRAADGTPLYGELLLPPGHTARASVPLILNPYGGPHVQTVREKWEKNALFDQLLVEHGLAVLRVDNRGMGHRGRSFAQAAYRDFGPVQLQDQFHVLDAVLAEHPQLDGQRLGWWGWSWGGSFTLYAMTHSTRLAVGAAVAPVTDWRLYDSAYTERYLSLPKDDAQNYTEDAVVSSADHLHGRLLVAHGTGDDNVHVANTMQWIDALMAAGSSCDLLLYPRLTHSLDTPEARAQLYGKILAEFEQVLHPVP